MHNTGFPTHLFLSLTVLSPVFALPSTIASLPTLDRRQDFPAIDPEPCTGNCSFIHDPAVIQAADGSYHRFSTNGNIAIAKADDLTGPWTYQGALLPEGSSIQVADGQEMWAPDVTLIDGTYHTFYSVSKIGSQDSQIGLATSDSLDSGTWTDYGAVSIPADPRWNRIDPNLFHEAEGQPYYFLFGSAWQDIFQTQLDPNSGFTEQTGDGPVQKAYNSSGSITEGGFMFWLPDEASESGKYYYLLFSSGTCCARAFAGTYADPLPPPGDEYKIMVCRSSFPTGPFVDDLGRDCATGDGGKLVLGSHGGHVYAPGGQGVLRNGDGRLVLYYHYVDPSVGYKYEEFLFGFNYLEVDGEGWPVVVGR